MPDENGKPTQEELLAALFIQPETKEDLWRWIKVYLGLDMPDQILDPDSNSSPMDLIWELYDAARLNKPDYGQVLAYASRDSFKTFSAAIFEVLCMVLLERSVAHMAAIQPQANKSIYYLKKHLNRPFLKDFVTSKNERTTEITRYYNATSGENLTVSQYEALPIQEQGLYREIKNYVTVVICTIQGANSEHVPVFIVDEVDVVENPDAYEESKMIPAPMNGMMPITLYTSTRKYSYGLVQKEIDNSANNGLIVRHWNIIDVTHHCPATRHRPDLPRTTVYYSDDTLRTISPEEYATLDLSEKEKYNKDETFTGCITNCRIFAACRGRLANGPPCPKCNDKGVGCPGFLKPVEHTQALFGKVTLSKAQAQLLCRKPSTEGLIYPNFSREIHMLSAAEMAEKIDGEKRDPSFTKVQLIELLKERGARFVCGLDHGFSHNFAAVTGAIYGGRAYIFDVISQPGLELSQKVDICKERLHPWEPEVWPDTAYPADNKTLRKDAGLRIKEWNKGKGTVEDGISLVRYILMPALGRREDAKLFFLKGDDGCELLATRIGQYHWTTDAAGRMTNVPDDEDDDECDALRYLVLNTFAPKQKISVTEVKTDPANVPLSGGNRQYDPATWMRQIIAEKTGIPMEEEEGISSETPATFGKTGSFNWSL